MAHVFHVWWLHGLTYKPMDAVLFLDIRSLVFAIHGKIRYICQFSLLFLPGTHVYSGCNTCTALLLAFINCVWHVSQLAVSCLRLIGSYTPLLVPPGFHVHPRIPTNSGAHEPTGPCKLCRMATHHLSY